MPNDDERDEDTGAQAPADTDLRSDPLGRRVGEAWQLTYPIIAASLTTLAVGFVDTIVVGRYSTDALATVGLALPIFVLASAFVLPLGTAVQVLVARWRGAGDNDRVCRILDVGLLVCTAAASTVAVVLIAAARPVTEALAGGDPPAQATDVLRILACALPFVGVTAHYRGAFGGLKQTRIAMQVSALVAVTNIPLDIWLVFGLDLGALGSALGTLVATILGAIYIVSFGRRRIAPAHPFWRRANLRDPLDVVRPLWRIGWPDVAFGGVAYGADVLMVGIVASIGPEPLAAHRTVTITIMLMWVIVFGCSTGTSILAGQRLGAGDLPGVESWRRTGTILTALLVLPILLPVLLTPESWFGLFSDNPGVVTEATTVAPLLALIAAGMIAAMPTTGVLRAGGDTRGILSIGLASQAIVGLAVAYLAGSVAGLGLRGVALGFVASWVTRVTGTWLRYRAGTWQRNI